jgi:hypothetical protein
MSHRDTGTLTLAYGVPKYVDMAVALARTLRRHAPGIPRAIVTDRVDDRRLREWFDIVIPLRKEYGSNVRQKLYLDHYSPFRATAFIDCDSLAVRDIQFIFDALKGTSFTVPGERYLTPGQTDPFIDVDRALAHFRVPRLPKFNGGLYYFERDEAAGRLFGAARDLLAESRTLPFHDFRGDGPGDEPIIAVAMTLHGQHMHRDGGTMMQTPIGIVGALDIDVIGGTCAFQKGDRRVTPAIVHFAGAWCEHPIYYREVRRLERTPADAPGSAPGRLLPAALVTSLGYRIAMLRFYAGRMLKQPKFARHFLNRLKGS